MSDAELTFYQRELLLNIVTVLLSVVYSQVMQLKMTIGNLVMSMIEENTEESLLVAKVNIQLQLCTVTK